MDNKDLGRVGSAETGSTRSAPEAPAGLRPSGDDPARSVAKAVRRYNAALREREAISRFLAIRSSRALVRYTETPWWRPLERLKLRWAAAGASVAAGDIENGKHHEDQAAWITELGQGYLRIVPRDSDRYPEGGDGEAGSGSEASRARAEGIAQS